MKNVAILGASDNPNRYAHLAQVRLQEQGYFVYPISRSGKDILGVRGYTRLNQVDEKLDTITLYLNPIHLIDVLDDILEKKPIKMKNFLVAEKCSGPKIRCGSDFL